MSDERLFTGHSGRLLGAVSLGWLAVQAGRLSLSPMLTTIGGDLGVDATRLGLALTLMWGLYAVLQYPSGRLADRLSRKTPLVAGIGCLVVGFAVLGLADGYSVFVAGAAVAGVGAGLYPTAARALVSDLFVERRGQAFGLHTGSGDLGGVAAAGLAAAAVAVAVWRAAFLPVIAVLLLVALAIHTWSRESYVVARPELGLRETASRLFGSAALRRLVVVYTLYAFAWQSAVAFLPTYLHVGKAFSPTVSRAAFAVLFAVGAVVKPTAGRVGDVIPRETLAPACLTLAALALGGVVLAGSPAVALVAVVLFAAGLMSFPPVMQAHLMDTFPEESAGGDLGATRAVYVGLAATGPTYVGVVAEAVDYRTAFVGLVCCLGLGALLLALAR